MKRILGIVVVMVLAFVGVSGYAVPLTAGEGTFSFTARTLEGEGTELNVSELNLMGRDEEGYLIHADKQILRVSSSDIQALIDSIGSETFSGLPTASSFTELAKGAKGEAVIKLQEKLIKTKYMAGKADGDYGNQTLKAVTAFQKATGLEANGVATVYTQMLLESMAQDPIAISPKLVTGGRFENITSNSNADLSGAVERNLLLDFDEMSGVGMITNGNSVKYSAAAVSDIDKCDFTFRFGLNVQENNDGSFTVQPAMNITSVSVRRPIVQEITLKSGSQRFTFKVAEISSELSGIKSKETATVVLSKEAAAMLAKVAEVGELKLRVNCRYNTYDISVPTGSLADIADIGFAAQGL